jgi:hypothetical protein
LKTPLTESSNLLRIKNNWKNIIGFELQSKFQRIIQLISIEETTPLATHLSKKN